MYDHRPAVAARTARQGGSYACMEFARKHGALMVLVLLVGVNLAFTPNFANVNTFWNMMIQVSSVLLVALGMTVVISSGGIDISVGSIMAIASIVTAKALGFGVGPAIVAGLATAALFGAFSGFMISKFKIQPIIVTLTIMISGRGIAQVINDAQLLNFTEPSFSFFGTHRLFGVVPVQVLIVGIAVASVYFLMNRMTFGLYVQAIGDNGKASRLSGVNIPLVMIGIYGISALLAGTAGLLETARLSAADANSIGKLIELDAIAAVAVGGTPLNGGKARVIGTAIGALIMIVITVSVNMNNIPYAYALVLKSIIIILAIYLQRERRRV